MGEYFQYEYICIPKYYYYCQAGTTTAVSFLKRRMMQNTSLCLSAVSVLHVQLVCSRERSNYGLAADFARHLNMI